MNCRIWAGLAMVAGWALLAAHAAPEAAALAPAPSPGSAAPAQPTVGVRAAEALSTITGVAISPLLGVSGVGAWKYLQTASDRRRALPWFAQPWFWIPGLLVVLLCFAKDVMGPAVPLVLKKPLDALEVFENKISGLVAAGAFVPLVAVLFEAGASGDGAALPAGLAFVDGGALVNAVTVPLAILCFALVWMTAHVINVLIVVSPFATLDAGLKSARLFLLSTVAFTSFANAYVGAAWSIVLIVAAYFLAGWSFRLTFFGTVFAFDLLTRRHKRFVPKSNIVPMFTARKTGPVPVRTYGRLGRDDQGQLVFRYHPWLVLPTRTLAVPPGRYGIGRGLLFPEITQLDGEKRRSLFLLPPRYRTHEEDLAAGYGFSEVTDVGLARGGRAVWQWLKALFAPARQPAG